MVYFDGYLLLFDGNSFRICFWGRNVWNFYVGIYYVGYLNLMEVYNNFLFYNIEVCELEEMFLVILV